MGYTAHEVSQTFEKSNNTLDEKKNEYHGVNRSGLIKLVINGKRVLGKGELAVIDGSAETLVTGTEDVVLGSLPNKETFSPEISIRCVDIRAGNQYQFRGVVRPVTESTGMGVIDDKHHASINASETESEKHGETSLGSTTQLDGNR